MAEHDMQSGTQLLSCTNHVDLNHVAVHVPLNPPKAKSVCSRQNVITQQMPYLVE